MRGCASAVAALEGAQLGHSKGALTRARFRPDLTHVERTRSICYQPGVLAVCLVPNKVLLEYQVPTQASWSDT